MNAFFKSKVEKLQEKLIVDKDATLEYAKEHMSGGKKMPEFKFETVGTKSVLKIIGRLKNTGAQGRDQISTKILKQFKKTLAPSLRHVVNTSIRSGKYPEGWKLGLITPLPKSGDLSVPKNWRPVCILPAPSKVLEGVLQAQLQDYMEEERIYSNSQHAYRKSRSCESALIELDTIIQKARNEEKAVALVMTDMSAAFNLIKKEILVSQLKIYGFNRKSRDLVWSYLSERQTKCRIKEAISDPETLHTGVGEGSVLGPCFFIVGLSSVNIVARRTEKELWEEHEIKVEAHTLEFADDTSGLLVCKNEEELQVAINVMFNKFKHYFNSMGMALNPDKCELTIFRSKKKTHTLTLPGGQEEVKTVKLLGLFIDSDYKFQTHVSKVCAKLRFKIANIARVRPYISEERAKLITEALVLSTVNYMSVLYLRLPSNQKKIQKLVNKAMRVVLKADKRTHIEDMNRELYWLNMENNFEFQLIMSMRRIRQRLMIAPVTFRDVFTNQDLTLYRLRSVHLRVNWRKYTAHGRNSFVYQAIQGFNRYELNSQYFESELEFKRDVKFKIYRDNNNGNVT